MIPVAANDVAFSTHAVLVTAVILFQILIYDVRGFYLSNLLGDWSIEFGSSPFEIDHFHGFKFYKFKGV